MDLALTSEEMKFRSDLRAGYRKFCLRVRLVGKESFHSIAR